MIEGFDEKEGSVEAGNTAAFEPGATDRAKSTLSPATGACTGISLATTQGDYVHARTIEWGHFDLNSKLIVSPRRHLYTSQLPMEKQGISWTAKHGFVGISVSQDNFIGEGMNEAGLNAGLFYFKGFGSLAPFDPDDVATSIIDMDLVRWMLSQFATVDEVKAAFPSLKVAPVFIDADGNPSPTAHWRATDKSGGSIVIEIIGEGQVHIYDNHVGVITNSPYFPWQVLNLNNYINVRPGTVAPRMLGDQQLSSFGTGTAAWGLPGDFSPPSRFVRAAFFRSTTPPLATPLEAVSQAFHILNNFDIPIGVEFGDDERQEIAHLPSATQWTAVSDLTNKLFYYKTMRDSAVKRVDLNEIDFDSGSEAAYALDEGSFTFEDVNPKR
jgi:choloylglycine hydrolase